MQWQGLPNLDVTLLVKINRCTQLATASNCGKQQHKCSMRRFLPLYGACTPSGQTGPLEPTLTGAFRKLKIKHHTKLARGKPTSDTQPQPSAAEHGGHGCSRSRMCHRDHGLPVSGIETRIDGDQQCTNKSQSASKNAIVLIVVTASLP